MSEDPRNDTSSQSEPSMEDILASIRRILAEDGETDQDDDPNDQGENEPLPQPDPVDIEVAHPDPDPSSEFAAEIAVEEPIGEDSVDLEPEPTVDLEKQEEAPMAEARAEEPVFELTPAMKAAAEHALLSRPAADSSTDVLSQLAKAILNRRDVSISASQVTLEDMVREMLRPLLKEWLDRNLPYLIERLVKREMDIMVNRAERLE